MTVHGKYDERFSPVIEHFSTYLESGADVGAALSLYVHGTKAIDVWGGTADPASGTPWIKDTLVPVFSCSKGVLTLCLLQVVDEGLVDLSAPVACYWPEFAASGKGPITVEHLLTHRAGLPLIDADLTLDEVLAWDPVISALESQAPLWEPGTAYAYHATTFGWLIGEVIRRVSGQTPGQFLRSRFAEPLGLDTWIGLPRSEHDRVATLLPSQESMTPPGVVDMIQQYLKADDRVLRAATVNGVLRIPFPGIDSRCGLNDAAVRSAEIPAGNCITTARSLAKLYANAVTTVDGNEPTLSGQLRLDATQVRSEGPQYFGLPGAENAWGLGFQLSNPTRPMLGASSFGHDGAGGELAFADYDHGIGFAYLHNQMGGIPDTRANDLVDAVRRCLE